MQHSRQYLKDRFITPRISRFPVQSLVQGRALLCMLKTNVHDHRVFRLKLDELGRLVETLGIEVVGDIVQSRHRPLSKYHIGSGKVREVKGYVKKHDINIVVFYNILRSSQKLNLIRALGVDVVDRYEVTLEIFDKMASDNLSNLQIEAARLEKLAPFFKLQANLRYHNDRPFFRSMGEYAFHSQIRELTGRQARIREEIESLLKEKRQRISKRERLGFPTICISGYYNAGKTSLFNALTGDSKPVSDAPFTTLSSKYQRRFIDYQTTLLFIDTIGFVIDLDPHLIRSFELNLEDLRRANLVILLLDISDPPLTLRIKLNEGIRLLREMDIPKERIIVVFNKIDLRPETAETTVEELYIERYDLPWIMVSALSRENLDELLELLTSRLREQEDSPTGAPSEEEIEVVGEG